MKHHSNDTISPVVSYRFSIDMLYRFVQKKKKKKKKKKKEKKEIVEAAEHVSLMLENVSTKFYHA